MSETKNNIAATADSLRITLTRDAEGSLSAKVGDAEAVAVHARQCFPWAEPSRFISLRDDEHNEIALIEAPDTLDEDSRAALFSALEETGFVIEVDGVEEIETEFEIRNWKVSTNRGDLLFQTKLDEFPRKTAHGRLIMRDVAGNLIVLGDPQKMDDHSRKLLWPFVD